MLLTDVKCSTAHVMLCFVTYTVSCSLSKSLYLQKKNALRVQDSSLCNSPSFISPKT